MRCWALSHRLWEFAILFHNTFTSWLRHPDPFSKCMWKAFSKLNFRLGKKAKTSRTKSVHIWAIPPTNFVQKRRSPSWAHPSRQGILCRNVLLLYRFSFWLSFEPGYIPGRINFMTSTPARSTGHLTTFSVLGILNQDTIINIFKSIFAFTNVLIPMLSFLGVHYIGSQVKMHVFWWNIARIRTSYIQIIWSIDNFKHSRIHMCGVNSIIYAYIQYINYMYCMNESIYIYMYT